jgi:hypothetical protein
MLITGQAIHAAFYEVAPFNDALRAWDEIHPTAQITYNLIAQKLNAQYLAPLQGLVWDWQELVQAHDEINVKSLAEIELWDEDWEKLKKRTQQLLGAEQKEG